MKWILGSLRREPPLAAPEQPRWRIDLGKEEPEFAIYAIGDVHGCLDLLRAAEEKVRRDVQRTNVAGLIIMLGDYVDRGPDSRGVLDHLFTEPGNDIRRITLCGNHDDLFMRFLDAPHDHSAWLDMGGRETLSSYGMPGAYVSLDGKDSSDQLKKQLVAAIPDRHRTLLAAMPVSLRIGNYLFVHAGIRPGIPLENQSDKDMMWIREPFLTQGPQLPITLIHGHTPGHEPSYGPGRIGIDTGAYASGKLSILKLFQGEASVLHSS